MGHRDLAVGPSKLDMGPPQVRSSPSQLCCGPSQVRYGPHSCPTWALSTLLLALPGQLWGSEVRHRPSQLCCGPLSGFVLPLSTAWALHLCCGSLLCHMGLQVRHGPTPPCCGPCQVRYGALRSGIGPLHFNVDPSQVRYGPSARHGPSTLLWAYLCHMDPRVRHIPFQLCCRTLQSQIGAHVGHEWAPYLN